MIKHSKLVCNHTMHLHYIAAVQKTTRVTPLYVPRKNSLSSSRTQTQCICHCLFRLVMPVINCKYNVFDSYGSMILAALCMRFSHTYSMEHCIHTYIHTYIHTDGRKVKSLKILPMSTIGKVDSWFSTKYDSTSINGENICVFAPHLSRATWLYGIYIPPVGHAITAV
jgi:hypothetical protein